MEDVFNQTIVCNDCKKRMLKSEIAREGFRLRALECPKCKKHIIHPADLAEFKRFSQLKQRPFAVKLRMVGNSYTVSIPREIINLEQQMHHEMKKEMDRMNKIVRLMLESPGKLSLFFNEPIERGKEELEEEAEE